VLNYDRSTVKHFLQNTPNDCYQWLSNSFRVHQIRFWPGPDPLSGLRGPTTKGRGAKEQGKEGRGDGQGTEEWKGRGRDARERGGEGERREGGGKKVRTPLRQFLPTPLVMDVTEMTH